MCANGGNRPSAAFLFMRDTRGNELFGVYTREAFENWVVRASTFNSPASPFAQYDTNWIGLGLGQCESVLKKQQKIMNLLKELSRCTISIQHSDYDHNSQNYFIRKRIIVSTTHKRAS